MSADRGRARAEIDLGAIAHNVRALAARAPASVLCAVVKADGYGHGAVAVAETALRAGARWLAVAHAAEGEELRRAGIEARVLMLSEPTGPEVAVARRARLDVVCASAAAIDRLQAGSLAPGGRGEPPLAVHLKVDTGMRRVGCDPVDAVKLARSVAASPALELTGVMTHLANADEPDDQATEGQLDRFASVLSALDRAQLRPGLVHAANSAGLLAHPASHFDLVRPGIAVYGLAPSAALAGAVDLRPALRLVAPLSFVKRVRAGERISYGLRHRFERDTVVATLPIGYADGVRRALGLAGAEVLVGGRRCPMVGVVTMDQTMVDCGPDATVAVGEDAVLIGTQGQERTTAEDWATALGTINYEIVTGLGARIERRYCPAPSEPVRP
ncbi:MAG: alanine racemase [Acidimicrobiia bacterium]|nr:alanine racemase [Acidimicrobiia bacterium]